MLETGRVGRVTGDGNIYVFFPHDSDAFAYIVGSVAVYFCPGAVGVSFGFNNFQFAGIVIKFGLYVSKTVDPGDDHSSIFSQAVQDHPQRIFPNFVGHFSDFDSTFSSREGFVACQKSEALCFFA